jgi:hypothetical protein
MKIPKIFRDTVLSLSFYKRVIKKILGKVIVIKRFISTIIYVVLLVLLIKTLIYFSGEFKIKDSDRQAIFAATVAIGVFLAGLFANSISNKLKQMQKDKLLKKVFVVNLKTIIKGLMLQIDDFKSAIIALKSTSPDNAKISSYAELDYFEVNKIPSEDLYRIFIVYLPQWKSEDKKIICLENLRTHLRFIEISRELIYKSYQSLYDSFHESSNLVISGMAELSEFYNKEATNLFIENRKLEEDTWFFEFFQLYEEALGAYKTTVEDRTDFEKLETIILPKFATFSRSHIEDRRTPTISSIYMKIMAHTVLRKEMIINMISLLEFYLTRYQESLKIVESSIIVYSNKIISNDKANMTKDFVDKI